MTTSPIVPCIWFDDQAEQASSFYVRTFAQGRISAISRYPESRDNPTGKPRGSVLTVEFEICGQRFTALNGGPQFTLNPSVSFFANVDTEGISTWMSSQDSAARDRAFEAMLGMGKLDFAARERAFRGA